MTTQQATDLVSTTTASIGSNLSSILPYAIPTIVILGILFLLLKRFRIF